MTKPPVARKLAVGHLCDRQLVFWLLVVLSFYHFKMHAWSTSKLLLLHSAFMLSMVKMLLKGEVGGRALNSHGNYIVVYGKSLENQRKIVELCFRISVGTLLLCSSILHLLYLLVKATNPAPSSCIPTIFVILSIPMFPLCIHPASGNIFSFSSKNYLFNSLNSTPQGGEQKFVQMVLVT